MDHQVWQQEGQLADQICLPLPEEGPGRDRAPLQRHTE